MKVSISLAALFLALSFNVNAEEKLISETELRNKIAGYWMGQIVGNYVGFPFESLYNEKTGPMPVSINRYVNCHSDYDLLNGEWKDLKIHCSDRRGFTDIVASSMQGVASDDDTDIEFVYLNAVERYGLDINYQEICEVWKKHINHYIWGGNAVARQLMDEGLLPPETGKEEHNRNWFYIDAQIENEIWGVLYPGMPGKAAEKTDWSARITNDQWTVQMAVAYSVMYSAAFFEDDVEKLTQRVLEHIPHEGPFFEGLTDLLTWYGEGLNWEDCWHKVVDKYRTRYVQNKDLGVPARGIAGLHNALVTIMAVLYGEGDFMKTLDLAVRAGFDNDCNAATAAGLIATMDGADVIPKTFLYDMPAGKAWETPFNNRYVNFTRDELPQINEMDDIIDRIFAIAEGAILENGGKRIEKHGAVYYQIREGELVNK